MNSKTKELIKAERRRNDFTFITEVVQRGRTRPKKYKHYLRMPTFLYEEMRDRNWIDPERYFIDESAFFEFTEKTVTISFMTLCMCEDLHRHIDQYLVIKFAGSYPIERGGRFF